jgi:hypothetical protein
MKKPGRPRKNGVKPAWVLHRTAVGLLGYDTARSSGEKYAEGLKAGVAKVREEFPDMPMSETEMKRILAEFRPKELELTLLFRESENTVTALGRKCKKAWQISIGPQPEYPRHNAHVDRTATERRDEAAPATKS